MAISGRVLDEQGKPVPGAQVDLTVVPEELKARLTGAASTARDWAMRDERPDRTMARGDGFFYFLDLPAGRYTVQMVDPRTGIKAEKNVSVSWTEAGELRRATADLVLVADRRRVPGRV